MKRLKRELERLVMASLVPDPDEEEDFLMSLMDDACIFTGIEIPGLEGMF